MGSRAPDWIGRRVHQQSSLVPPADRDPDRFSPIFVLAPARSYSSVVTAMVGQHPALYGFPELVLFATSSMADRRPPDFEQAGLLRAVAQLEFGGQHSAHVENASRWLAERSPWPVACIYDHLLERVAPLIGIEKSPANTFSDESLARINRLYPKARLIHLVRHPTTTVTSIIRLCEYGARKAGRTTAPDLPARAYKTWYEVHRRIIVQTMHLEARHAMRVRGEDVVNHPRRELHRVAEWLDLPSHEAAIEAMCHPEMSPYAMFGPPNAPLGNDWQFLREPRLRRTTCPTSLEVPAAWRVPRSLQAAARRLANHFGYE